MDYYEQLIGDYFEEKGYFLQRNIRYGNNNEADLFGINPKTGEKIHIEITEQNKRLIEFKSLLEKKFNNKYLKGLYKNHFGSSNKIKKIYLVWWHKSNNNYKNKRELEKKFGVEIISYEDIFTYFKKNYEENLGDTRKIRHLIDCCFTFEDNTKNNDV